MKQANSFRIRWYPVFEDAIAAGITLGWSRAWKHVDMPEALAEPGEADRIKESILEEVMTRLCEIIEIPEPGEQESLDNDDMHDL